MHSFYSKLKYKSLTITHLPLFFPFQNPFNVTFGKPVKSIKIITWSKIPTSLCHFISWHSVNLKTHAPFLPCLQFYYSKIPILPRSTVPPRRPAGDIVSQVRHDVVSRDSLDDGSQPRPQPPRDQHPHPGPFPRHFVSTSIILTSLRQKQHQLREEGEKSL